jgi:Na+/H+-dicarboxylate symporter
MASYVLTVLTGLLMLMLVYLLLLKLLAGQHPIHFLKHCRDVLLLAFSTSSSAAVMPLSIRTAQEKLAVRPSIAQFVIPLGATINMNGTALYQSVATVFLAQVYGIDLSMASMALVVAMAVGASIGSPATPGVGIVILAMVLTTVGIPPSGIALIMGVDRILDMSRTAVNVTGDLVTSRLMEAWTRKQAGPADKLAELESASVKND